MGQILSTTVGVGFAVPDDVLERAGILDLSTMIYAEGLKLIGADLSYYYDYYTAGYYVYIRRLTKTFYDAGFNELEGHITNGVTASKEEMDEIDRLARHLGYPGNFEYPHLVRFVETSIG